MIFTEEKYNELIQDIFSKHPSVQNAGFTSGSYKPGLSSMIDFHEKLGSPANDYRIIHIAGTNGKGSVSSMLAASFAARGFKVGLYTSPHLLDFRERIKIIQNDNYQLISKEYVFDFLSSHSLSGLSFFEITTALAFKYYSDQKVDIAIIETGLGGRLDSTNIVNPILSVITSIGLDHCALLGNSLEEIAREKAGIIKESTPVVIGTYNKVTAPIFEEIAKEKNSQIVFASYTEFSSEVESSGFAFMHNDEITYFNILKNFDLKGAGQLNNLNTTVRCLELLGIEPNIRVLASTAKITGLRGRWEIIQKSNPMIICDIAHNPAALKKNFELLKEMNRPLFIVFGVMADKDYKSIREMMPQEANYYGVAPKCERALPVEKLSEVLNGLNFVTADSVTLGAKAAIEAASQVPDSIVYIGGSNFVVAEYYAEL